MAAGERPAARRCMCKRRSLWNIHRRWTDDSCSHWRSWRYYRTGSKRYDLCAVLKINLYRIQKKEPLWYESIAEVFNIYSVSVQGAIRSMKDKFKPLCRYFHSAYVFVRVVQVPKRGLNLSLHDSQTSTAEISALFKADDWGVLDVRRLRITPQNTKISWFEACVSL